MSLAESRFGMSVAGGDGIGADDPFHDGKRKKIGTSLAISKLTPRPPARKVVISGNNQSVGYCSADATTARRIPGNPRLR
jgi:hypothetical protein